VDRRRPASHTPAAAAIHDFVVFDPAADVDAAIRQQTGGRGADVVYDAVGGVTTQSALAALAHRGRLVVISAIGSPSVAINLLDLYHNETRILGTDSGKLSVVDSARRLDAMAPYFESGQFRPLPITATYPLDDAAAAYQAVADHTPGRVVIRP
jgi:NADPH:quinone reductase-like Zn-dependent oxidoreductase